MSANGSEFDPEDFDDPSQDPDPFSQVDPDEDDFGDDTEDDTDTDPAPDRQTREEREETYQDAFDDDDGTDTTDDTEDDSDADEGGSDLGPGGMRGPGAEERAETIGGDEVTEAAEELDEQTDDVQVEPQDVTFQETEEGTFATVGGAAGRELASQEFQERFPEQDIGAEGVQYTEQGAQLDQETQAEVSRFVQQRRQEGLERMTRDRPEERAFSGLTEPEQDVRSEDETLDVLGPGEPARENGETYLDERIDEGVEQATTEAGERGIDTERVGTIVGGRGLMPPQGDLVQQTEANLEEAAQAQREGRGLLPSPDEAEEAVRTRFEAQREAGFEGPGTELSEDFTVGFARSAAQATNIPQQALGLGRTVEGVGETAFDATLAQLPADSGGEISIPGVEEETIGELQKSAEERQRERGGEFVETTEQTIEQTEESFEERPTQTLGSAAFEGAFLAGTFAASAGAARLGTRVARGVRDRTRTAGGTRVDPEDITQRSVIEGDEDFPGAQNPSLYRSQPARAVREQAEERTPDVVEERFQEAGFEEGTTLKKAVEVEPEGPQTRTLPEASASVRDRDVSMGGRRVTRSGGGFEVQTGDYESPGGFVGPELSPNFLGVEPRQFSLRPGLPDFGGSPTGVLIRTDVEEPQARTMAEFNRELIDREGETTALTKPPGSVATGEIEAVIPPGAQFRDIGGGVRRRVARRFGIGSDFYTEVEGRRVPLRPVVRDDEDIDVDTPTQTRDGDGDVDDVVAYEGSLDELTSPVRSRTDRPVSPLSPASGVESTSTTEATTQLEPSTPSQPSSPSSRVSSTPRIFSSLTFGSPTTTPSGTGPTSPSGIGSPTIPPSGGPPSSPGGSGGSPTPETSTPGTPLGRPPDSPDADDEEEETMTIGLREDVFADFVDPLTGERTPTDGPTIPGLDE